MLGDEEDEVTDSWLEQSNRFDNDIDEDQSMVDRLTDRLKRLKRLCNPLAFCLFICTIILLVMTIIAWRDRPAGLSPPGTLPAPFFQSIIHTTNQSIIRSADGSINTIPYDGHPRLKTRPSLHASSCAKHYPAHQSPDGSLPKPNGSYRYYFAINLFNNDEIIPDMFQELHRVFTSICEPSVSQSINQASNQSSTCPNVFVSIYESGSIDQTKKELTMFSSFFHDLDIPHSITSNQRLIKQQNLYRIDHLAAVRNQAMAPFFEQHLAIKQQSNNQSLYHYESSDLLYDKLVWLNDVIFCAEDVIRLINTSIGPVTSPINQQSAEPRVHMACGLDFWEHAPISFYDTWVMRGLDGKEPYVDYPWFVDPLMKRGIETMKTFPVFCCWNGLVVLSAWEWLQYGLSFRAHDDENIHAAGEPVKEGEKCEASECTHVCENYWAIHGEKTHIVVDPLVNVAYRFDVYQQIEQQHWFQHSQRSQSINQSINDMKTILADILTDHTPPTTWQCRNINYQYSQHPVILWSKQDTQKHKQDYEINGWSGWKQIEFVEKFGK